jgi:hypothetical protein
MREDPSVVDGVAADARPLPVDVTPRPPALRRGGRITARILLACYLVLAAALTIGPERQGALDWLVAAVGRLAGVSRVHETAVEAPANVLLFIPIGLLLGWGFPRIPALAAWLLCAAASVAVEIAQEFLPGRTPSLVDVATNSAGAAIGVLLYAVAARRWLSRSGSSRR